jgi:hypothetical protein
VRVLAGSVLAFESIVVLLAIPVATTVEDVPTGRAIAVGAGLAIACIVAAALLRSRVGYVLGSVIQVGVVSTGFVIPVMFVVGGVFAALWVTAIVLGRSAAGPGTVPDSSKEA